MQICRYMSANGPAWGAVEGGQVYALQDNPLEAFEVGTAPRVEYDKRIGAAGNVALLAPVAPPKMLCIGRNYAEHAAERGHEVPKEPLVFLKPPTTLIGPGQPIVLRSHNGNVHHEAELAIVIGRGGFNIPQEMALDHVLGYTCANDVSDRDFQANDGQWWRAKGQDTFCPLGPWITNDIEASDVRVTCRINGELRQDSRTSLMVYKIPFLVSYLSRFITLETGDLILTGTPAGVGPIRPGEVVEIEVEGIGVLSNPVVQAD